MKRMIFLTLSFLCMTSYVVSRDRIGDKFPLRAPRQGIKIQTKENVEKEKIARKTEQKRVIQRDINVLQAKAIAALEKQDAKTLAECVKKFSVDVLIARDRLCDCNEEEWNKLKEIIYACYQGIDLKEFTSVAKTIYEITEKEKCLNGYFLANFEVANAPSRRKITSHEGELQQMSLSFDVINEGVDSQVWHSVVEQTFSFINKCDPFDISLVLPAFDEMLDAIGGIEKKSEGLSCAIHVNLD